MKNQCVMAFAGLALASTSSAQVFLGLPGAEIFGGTNAAILATAIAGLTVDDQYDISNDLEDWDNVVPDFTSLGAML